MDRSRLFGISLILTAAVGYGSGGLFARPAYEAGADWLTVMAWRFGLAMVAAWVVVAARPRSRAWVRSLARREIAVTLVLGAMLVLHSGTYYAALETVPLSLTGLIISIYPPVVAILAVWIGRPLEGRRAWLALGLTMAGMVLAVGGIQTDKPVPLPGLLLAMAAPLFYSFWIVLTARHSGETRETTGAESEAGNDALATGALLLTGTATTYWAIALAVRHPVLPADVPSAAWPAILGVAIAAGFIAPQAFYAGAKRVGGAQAALISTSEPLYTVLIAGLVLGETLSVTQWAGAALIIGGVVLSQVRGRRAAEGTPGFDRSAPVVLQPLARVSED